ncbi:hypothetical protein [Sphingomonas sp. PAMC 26621]|uniref:hypothetical protein n=1 Tax=Sphingomonas sp. PAMC 26621 TaxID=1112213 RepID=UPI0002EC1E17|nr:hypothetical protein [Sphingomonas sp. PAMC 26621]
MTPVEIVTLLRRKRLRVLRRPSGYLARFARGAGLARLPVDEQRLLAQYFRVDPRLFGER